MHRHTGRIHVTSLHCVSSNCLSKNLQKSHWLLGRELLKTIWKNPMVQAARRCRLLAVVCRFDFSSLCAFKSVPKCVQKDCFQRGGCSRRTLWSWQPGGVDCQQWSVGSNCSLRAPFTDPQSTEGGGESSYMCSNLFFHTKYIRLSQVGFGHVFGVWDGVFSMWDNVLVFAVVHLGFGLIY